MTGVQTCALPILIMVYAHPIVSFLRNYKRERKVPAQGLLGTWANVYNNIEKYKSLFGNNFKLVITPSSAEEEFEIKEFTKAYNNNQLQDYFNNLLSTGEFVSTFRKPDTNLSPQEKLKKELEALRKEREDEKKDWEAKEFARLQAEHERQLETDISAALDVGGLPKTARTVKAMAEYMMIALENGIDLSAKDIVPIVKNTTLSEFKEVINSLSDDQLEEFMGKEIIGRLRKKSVAKAKAIETASAVKPTGEGIKKPEDKKSDKKQTIRDFFGA